ncbi:hypothetical protein [Asticcacaulis sp.]|uniref:hypothetical protein n=1 Tax=Asticcacaulis sp. TaxID=1872648 RepID=UPI00261969EC|nr:hypothetical protein [Asticcacaulis sp.]
MDKEINSALWNFIRRDTSVAKFEAWVYAHEAALSVALGAELHFRLIEMNYADRYQVEDMRQQLEAHLRPALMCECPAVADEDVIAMGGNGRDGRFFASVSECAMPGDDLWWLWLGKCQTCHTDWLIAQEERIYDDFFVARLTSEQADLIRNNGQWPQRWLTYEDVLRTGRALSRPCRFVEYIAPSLLWTVEELRRARPDITVAEMSEFLGIEESHVKDILKYQRS